MLENITIDWKWAGIGAVIAIVLVLVILFVTNSGFISYLGVLIAAIIVGYKVNVDYKNGSVHGLASGFIAGIILGVIIILRTGATGLASNVGLGAGLTIGALNAILGIAIFGILGLLGGVIGALIKNYV